MGKGGKGEHGWNTGGTRAEHGLIPLRCIAPLLLCQTPLRRFRVGTRFIASARLPHLWGKAESRPGAQWSLTEHYISALI
jgi:hypothetical protein